MKMPEKPPSLTDLENILKHKQIGLEKLFNARVDDSQYLSYDDTKYRPLPDSVKAIGGDRHTWWILIMLGRMSRFQDLPLSSANDEPFKFFIDNTDSNLLHEMDLNGGGMLGVDEIIPSEKERNKYFVSSLIEESFSSSFMEGAVSTRDLAKKMIAENRKPQTKGERMILNNFETMQKLAEWKTQPLSPELICTIHAQIADGTLDDSKLGKFRTQADKDVVLADDQGNVYHTPCPCEKIPEKIEELCRFANIENSGGNFIHPVVKAIILHFMLAYIHPFPDGNGRTARTLFYWYLLKNNYWIAKFISISKIILESGNRYYLSFLNTERDYNDLNYFIKFQLEVFGRAIRAFHEYIARKQKELNVCAQNNEIFEKLNDRESALCLKIVKNPIEKFETTIEAYAELNGIVWETSRRDLKHLCDEKILLRRKSGRAYVFSPTKAFFEKISR